MATPTQTPIPSFYDANNASDWNHRPDVADLFTRAQTYRTSQGIKASASDKTNITVLAIDTQKDFTNPEGALYVSGRSGDGATEDSKRTAEFIYRNLGTITDVIPTLDSHVPNQIFFSSFWIDSNNNPAPPFTMISAADVRNGVWRVNPAMTPLCGNYGWLRKQAQFYVDQLEKTGKYVLIIWPFHCLIGSSGHVLNGLIDEARLFHAFVRQTQSAPKVKGLSPFTENYSVLRPEVTTRHDGKPLPGAQRDTNFISTLLTADAVAIVGQALSHCVKSTIDDLLDEIKAANPGLVEKVYIVEDCMSAVVSPAMDFTDDAQAALRRFESEGMHVVKSTDPVASWPNIRI